MIHGDACAYTYEYKQPVSIKMRILSMHPTAAFILTDDWLRAHVGLRFSMAVSGRVALQYIGYGYLT